MDPIESYEIRLEMAEMHEEYIERLSETFDKHHYVETVWYCYAVFEQRISRLIAKYIDKCTLAPDRTDDKSAAISTRITCLKKLVKEEYGAFNGFDSELLDRTKNWCDDRNELVHGLVSINHYKKYDEEFRDLAERGVPLVFELYDACTTFREQWYESEEPLVTFPVNKCRCKNNKCINPKCI